MNSLALFLTMAWFFETYILSPLQKVLKRGMQRYLDDISRNEGVQEDSFLLRFTWLLFCIYTKFYEACILSSVVKDLEIIYDH